MTSYFWPGGSEHMLWAGPEAKIQIIMVPPLLEEANRLRKTLVTVKRMLHARGFGVALPDLPGLGESEIQLHAGSFDDWRSALASLVKQRKIAEQSVFIASFRAGALIDTAHSADGVWRLAPETGARALRDLARIVRARHSALPIEEVFDHTGYRLPPDLRAQIEAAQPELAARVRTVRLRQDPHEADVRIDGAPLWRRSEPGEDPLLTQSIADDIYTWVSQCAAS